MQIAPYPPHRNNEIHATDFGREEVAAALLSGGRGLVEPSYQPEIPFVKDDTADPKNDPTTSASLCRPSLVSTDLLASSISSLKETPELGDLLVIAVNPLSVTMT